MVVVKQINKNFKLFQEVIKLKLLIIESDKVIDEKYWDDMIREADKNGDGEVLKYIINRLITMNLLK